MTYRLREHVGPNEDFHLGYRSREEAQPWLKHDPVEVFGRMIDLELRRRIESDEDAEIQSAFAFAEASSFPSDDELFTDVFEV
jgi:TPP-dependent pyruvate/acetoin dehydrogenase alpha subunit